MPATRFSTRPAAEDQGGAACLAFELPPGPSAAATTEDTRRPAETGARDALQAVTVEAVLQTLRITHDSLSRMLGRVPRIAVAGLNPHAGEGGLFGREEIEVIAPAIALAQQQGIDAHGPYAPDTVFMRARATSGEADGIDAVIAMYHDQGLIPVKYLGVEQGVNVTLGLPLVRTSPDHGTAFDIAGRGIARPDSLIAALRLADQIATTRG